MKINFLHCCSLTVLGVSALLLGGCATAPKKEFYTPDVVFVRTAKPIKADGVLDEAEWQKAPWHDLSRVDNYSGYPARDGRLAAKDHYETGRIKFLYDDKYIYIGCEMEDKDVIAKLDKDQEFLFRYGDLLEIFLSVDEPGGHYWELYAAPNGRKSSYCYPSSAMLMEHFFHGKLISGMQVGSKVNGTLNDHYDFDKGWSTEMIIPIKEIERYGFKFDPGVKWRLMAARYNHGRTLTIVQPSTYPPLPAFGFHSRQYYSPVVFR